MTKLPLRALLGLEGTRSHRRSHRSEERALTRETAPALFTETLPAESTITPRNALRLADAWSCIRALSDAAASLPLKTYRRTTEGRIPLEGGRGTELLERPAPQTTTANLVHTIMLHLNAYGNCFVGKFRTGGEITQLSCLHPERVQVRFENGAPVYTYTDTQGRRFDNLTTDDLVHIRGMSLDGVVGLSPIQQCRVSLGLASDLTEHASRFFSQDARPGGILTLSAANDQTAVNELFSKWTTAHTGKEGWHRIAAFAGEADFKPVSLPHRDAQFLESRQLSTLEICRIFRVPAWIISANDGSSMTYSNTEQQSLHFATYSLRPWLVLIEQALSADRELFPGGSYCEFSIDGLLRADAKSRAEVFKMALDPVTGWMSRAEIRELENLPPEEGAAAAGASVEQMVATANGNPSPQETASNGN